MGHEFLVLFEDLLAYEAGVLFVASVDGHVGFQEALVDELFVAHFAGEELRFAVL